MINRQKILYYLQPASEILAVLYVLFSVIAGFSGFLLSYAAGGIFTGAGSIITVLAGLVSLAVSALFAFVLLGAVYKLIAIDQRLAAIEQRLVPAQD